LHLTTVIIVLLLIREQENSTKFIIEWNMWYSFTT